MARKNPGQAPELPDSGTKIRNADNTWTEYVTQVREYKLITPLFGGGVEPGEADPVTVIRASEVRGHLRFWWRATRGGQFDGDLTKMKAAEDVLWGSASAKNGGGPSLVQVEVEIIERGFPLIPEHSDPQKQPLNHDGERISKEQFNNSDFAHGLGGRSKYEQFNKRENRVELRDLYAGSPESIDGYVAFPLRKEEKGQDAGVLLEGVVFRLRLSYPRIWPPKLTIPQKAQEYFNMSSYFKHNPAEEVSAALWAWETFGGVGARTRRGFGAIALSNWTQGSEDYTILRGNPATPTQVKEWITKQLDKIIVSEVWMPDTPHVSKTLRIETDEISKDSKWVWRKLGQKLKGFRQRRNKSFRGTSFGRSKWPEPDVVRKLTGMYYEDLYDPAHNHKTPIYDPLIEAFPRAAFGLPISFAFQRDQTNPKRTKTVDPIGTNTLEGDHADHQRFASPLIMRPIMCDSGEYVGLAVIIEGTRLPPMQLLSHKSLNANLTAEQAERIHKNGLTEIPTAGAGISPYDILEAFLKSLKGAK